MIGRHRRKGIWAFAALAISALAPAAYAQSGTMSLLPQDQPLNRPTSIWNFFQPVAPKPEPAPEPQESGASEEETAPPQSYKPAKVPLPPVIPRRPAVATTPVAAPAPQKVETAAQEQPEQADQAAREPQEAAEEAPAPRYTAARVPLPPVIPRRAAAGKQQATTAEKAVAAPVVVPEPPQPRPTGLFAMLAAYSQPEGAAPATMSDGDLMRPALVPPPTTRVAPETAATKLTKLDLSDPFRPKRLPQAPGERDDDLEDEETAPKLVEKQVDSVEIRCLKPELMAMIYKAGDHFGATPVITSGFRGYGRRGSYHRKCEAADFFIPDVPAQKLVQFLKALPGAGGVGTYCHTKSVHLDTGEPRNWHQCGFRRSFALRTLVTEIGSR